MKLEQQVCSLDLAKRLKELGVKQESAFWWRQGYSVSHLDIGRPTERKEFNVRDFELTFDQKPRYMTSDVKPFPLERAKIYDAECSAFTVAELGEMLPGSVKGQHSGNPNSAEIFYLEEWKGVFDFTVQYKGHNKVIHWVTEKPEADARAKMLIYLLENGLLKA